MDIDIVVLWVDGNDPEWIKEKIKYDDNKKEDYNAIYRFRDWGLMKYWFRGIDKFAPWVRKIHFVTWGHLPEFLNTDHEKLHVVRHEDFMPKEALPTFSARALELNIHRIEGLSDHFIFFNDDFFLTDNVYPNMFFHDKTGLPCIQFCELPTWLKGDLNAYQIAQVRSLAIINKYFSKRDIGLKSFLKNGISFQYPLMDNFRNIMMKILFPGYYTGFRTFHVPVPFQKEIFHIIWEKEPELLYNTTIHKFRNLEDVNQLLPFFWQIASGNFIPSKNYGNLYAVSDNNIETICKDITDQKYRMICINDPSDDIDFEKLSCSLDRVFSQILPDVCSFEKRNEVVDIE